MAVMEGVKRIFFVDFEAFQHGAEKFKPVEVCVLDSSDLTHPLIEMYAQKENWKELSSSQKRTYNYQFRHLHRLYWKNSSDFCSPRVYSGQKLYSKIIHAFNPRVGDIFYVFGEQKLLFLENEIPHLNWRNYHFINSFKEIEEAVAEGEEDYELATFLHSSTNLSHKMKTKNCALWKCIKLFHHWSSTQKTLTVKATPPAPPPSPAPTPPSAAPPPPGGEGREGEGRRVCPNYKKEVSSGKENIIIYHVYYSCCWCCAHHCSSKRREKQKTKNGNEEEGTTTQRKENVIPKWMGQDEVDREEGGGGGGGDEEK